MRTSLRILETLPRVRGRLTENAPLAPITWFGVGGPAEVMFRPEDADDLALLLEVKPRDVPFVVIGVGSNLLVRDGGIKGVVVRLGRGFTDVSVEGTNIRCGAAALDASVAMTARNAGLAGVEFLSGVPGTIGGALRMNAGAYGREIKDVLITAEAMDPEGGRHILSPADMGFAYRHCSVASDWIFTAAVFKTSPGNPAEIEADLMRIRAEREQSQPLHVRTGGSTFANPEGHKAWELIDQAGCRGLRRGGAMVSEKHCNFLINTGSATAADIEDLGEDLRRRVLDTCGVELQWEIRRVGIRTQQVAA